MHSPFSPKKERNKWAEKEGKRETLKKKGRKKEEEGEWAGKAEEEEEEEDNRTTRRRSIHIVSMHTVAVASWVQSERKGTHGREGIHQIPRKKENRTLEALGLI